MPSLRKDVSEVCEYSHSSENDRSVDPVRHREYSGAGVTDFEKEISGLRGPDGYLSAELPVYISRAPGRLDLMGGNVDYTGGLVFEATIREATWAAVQLRNDRKIVFWNPQVAERGWQDQPEFDLDELVDEETVRRIVNRDPAVRWTAY